MFISKIKLRLNQSIAAKDVAILTLGTALAQSITVASTPFLSRLFTPAEFGVVAVFTAVIAVVATFVTLRYEVNILVPKSNNEAEQLVFLSLALAICLGLIVSIVAWALPSELRDSLGVKVLESWLPLACLLGLVTAISTTIFGWLNRKQLYKQIAKLRVAQSIIFSSIAILLGNWNFQGGLLVAHMSSVLLVTLLIGRFLPTSTQLDLRSILLVAHKYNSTPKYALPTALLDVITQQVPIILIGTWYGSSEAGEFSLAWRVLILPVTLIGGAVGQIFFQRFAAAWPDVRAARSLLIKAWKILALVGLLPMIVLMCFGENLFSIIFGSSWANSGKMATILAPMLFISLIHSPTSTTSIVLGIQKHVFFLAILVLIYRPLSIYIGWKLGDIYLGLTIYCILEIVQILIFQYGIYRKIKFGMSY